MTTTVHAYAAPEAGKPLEPFEYELPELGPSEIDIKVSSCGICYSDLSMTGNDWGMSTFPLVPGHEAVGTVAATGEYVEHLAVGDKVGLGWHAGYCMNCQSCLTGHHNLCGTASSTIVGRHGGFADIVRAQATSAIKIPDALAHNEAGPLFCGGVTVFNPFVHYDVSPLARVGVVGIGGLGHLAIKFARAWGCHVTAFTSPAKQQEVLSLGAHDTINSRDPDAIKKVEGQFDLILSTVNVTLDWNDYMAALKPLGRLHVLGVVLEPMSIGALSLIFGTRSVSGSPVGSPATIDSMLTFAARHSITPVNEHFPLSRVNDAYEHLKSGKARYRLVLDVA